MKSLILQLRFCSKLDSIKNARRFQISVASKTLMLATSLQCKALTVPNIEHHQQKPSRFDIGHLKRRKNFTHEIRFFADAFVLLSETNLKVFH